MVNKFSHLITAMLVPPLPILNSNSGTESQCTVCENERGGGWMVIIIPNHVAVKSGVGST